MVTIVNYGEPRWTKSASPKVPLAVHLLNRGEVLDLLFHASSSSRHVISEKEWSKNARTGRSRPLFHGAGAEDETRETLLMPLGSSAKENLAHKISAIRCEL